MAAVVIVCVALGLWFGLSLLVGLALGRMLRWCSRGDSHHEDAP